MLLVLPVRNFKIAFALFNFQLLIIIVYLIFVFQQPPLPVALPLLLVPPLSLKSPRSRRLMPWMVAWTCSAVEAEVEITKYSKLLYGNRNIKSICMP